MYTPPWLSRYLCTDRIQSSMRFSYDTAVRSPPHLPLGGLHLGNAIPSRLRELTSHQYQCLIWTTISNSHMQITAQKNMRRKQKNPLSLICISSPPPPLSRSLSSIHHCWCMIGVMCCGTVTFHHFDVSVGPQKYSPYVTVPVVRQRGPCKGKRDGCVCPWTGCVCMCVLSVYNM